MSSAPATSTGGCASSCGSPVALRGAFGVVGAEVQSERAPKTQDTVCKKSLPRPAQLPMARGCEHPIKCLSHSSVLPQTASAARTQQPHCPSQGQLSALIQESGQEKQMLPTAPCVSRCADAHAQIKYTHTLRAMWQSHTKSTLCVHVCTPSQMPACKVWFCTQMSTPRHSLTHTAAVKTGNVPVGRPPSQAGQSPVGWASKTGESPAVAPGHVSPWPGACLSGKGGHTPRKG